MSSNNRQSGLASIVVVFMLAIIISLLSLGFSRLMDRAIQQASGNDLNAAADYAARVGINEAAAYLKRYNSGSSECDSLTKAGQPLSRTGGLSGDSTVKYTCVLIDTEPADIFYQILTPYKSQIAKLMPNNTESNINQLLVSWQAADRTKINYPLPDEPFLDENTWSDNKYPPALRLTVYPLSGKSDAKGAWNELKAGARTVFLYPSSSKSPDGDPAAFITRVNWATVQDGSRIPVICGTTKTDPPNDAVPNFVGTTNYDCNLIFFNLPVKAPLDPKPYTLYSRITPLYSSATNVRFVAQSGTQVVNFEGTQSIVDVTATAGNSSKRLQARVNIVPSEYVDPQLRPAEDAIPEYGLRTAKTICKLFIVPTSGNQVFVDRSPSGYDQACPTAYAN